MENDIVNDTLIESVRCHSCIYDKKDKYFKNTLIKTKAWQEVVDSTGLTMEECRYRWLVLLERFNKEQKRRDQSSVSGAPIQDEWLYYRNMEFLKYFNQPRRTRQTLFNKSTTEDGYNQYEEDLSTDNSTISDESSSSYEKVPKDIIYNEACEAVKSAAEQIRAQNTAQQTQSIGSRSKINEHCMKSILGLMEPLSEFDQDEAMVQILQYVVDLRRARLE